MLQKRLLSSEHLNEWEEIELEINSLDYKISKCLSNLKPKKQSKKFKTNHMLYE